MKKLTILIVAIGFIIDKIGNLSIENAIAFVLVLFSFSFFARYMKTLFWEIKKEKN